VVGVDAGADRRHSGLIRGGLAAEPVRHCCIEPHHPTQADQYGQVIDVFVSRNRDLKAARAFFATAIRSHGDPAEVTTDRAHTLVRVIAELLPAALHDTTQYANNRVEADHGRLKARLRPMRGLKRDRTADVVFRGHAFIQNLRRGHYELGVDALPGMTIAAAFDELALVV